MNRLEFSVDISADKMTIWDALWANSNYRDWASVFFEGSYMVADNLEEGGKVHFLGPDQNGIYSIIEKHVPAKTIQFKHLGTVVDAKEQTPDEESKKWSGATESYSISEENNSCILSVEIDVMDEHLEFMQNTFPLALEKIKKACS